MTVPSGVVDVLSVIEREIDRAGGAHFQDGRDLIAARAAVAELVEANQKIVAEWNYMAKHGHCHPGVLGTGQTFDCWAVEPVRSRPRPIRRCAVNDILNRLESDFAEQLAGIARQ